MDDAGLASGNLDPAGGHIDNAELAQPTKVRVVAAREFLHT